MMGDNEYKILGNMIKKTSASLIKCPFYTKNHFIHIRNSCMNQPPAVRPLSNAEFQSENSLNYRDRGMTENGENRQRCFVLSLKGETMELHRAK